MAPSGPPLTGPQSQSLGDSGEAGEHSGSPAELDPLVSNGLSSPLCTDGLAGAGASRTSRRNCETSGFLAAPAPTGNYGFDVHIETGPLGLGSDALLNAVQVIVITPAWMALVWAVHALVVMLEWAFTIDLLDSAAGGGLGRGLREMQAAITFPWLAAALSVASVLAVYEGLIRRRVSETFGHVLLMAAMVTAGMWVISDPAGTVGALGSWSNEASLGTLAAVASGTPSATGRVLGDELDSVFAAAVEGPWCYLEFGDVSWCRDPRRLDPRLRAAGLALAGGELLLIGCSSGTRALGVCVAPASAEAGVLRRSARLLREARTNGALFLALPANGPARNAISEASSLLRAICASSDANSCKGATAAEAEFRTAKGTWPRAGGLLLIIAGALGLMLLLGFIAVRLLAASLFSLLYLLLAPGLVLAPAFGETGRSVFRRWAGRLLAAVLSKLIFSFLLGAVLAVGAILSGLTALGWWTQWLLMSTFWWSAFMRRHDALGLSRGVIHHARFGHPRPLPRTVGRVVRAPSRILRTARSLGSRTLALESGSEVQSTRMGATQRPSASNPPVDEQARGTLERDQFEARAALAGAAATQERLARLHSRRERLRAEQAGAAAGGLRRRERELESRGARLDGQIAGEEQARASVSMLVERRRFGVGGREDAQAEQQRLVERTRFLDEQARLAPSVARLDDDGPRRDYAALAGLTGLSAGEYGRLEGPARRAATLQIDRELAKRPAALAVVLDPGAPTDGRVPRPPSRPRKPQIVVEREADPVWLDIREVAAGRKRQFGIGKD